MLNNKIVTIFGGSGFVGRAIIEELARDGYTIRVASRTPDACYELRTAGTPGQVVPQFYDPRRPEMIGSMIAGAYAVINCVGVLYERRRSTFHAAHVELTRQIATACKRYGVDRLVHISALGIDKALSKYARTKLQGEQIVGDLFPRATILRPSVIFGPNDQFFNRFARLAQIMPALPLIGGGNTQFQPVYVGDVARAVHAALDPTRDVDGKVFELGGPDVLTLRGCFEKMFDAMGTKVALMPLPWGLAKFQARVLQMAPKPLLTVDQVATLRADTIVTPGALTLSNLGVDATSLDVVLPTYLARFYPGGRFAEMKRAA